MRESLDRYVQLSAEHSNMLNSVLSTEPCRVAIQYPMLGPKEGLQSPCSWQHRNIVLAHGNIDTSFLLMAKSKHHPCSCQHRNIILALVDIETSSLLLSTSKHHPYSCQHQNSIDSHAAVLDLAS